MKKRLDVQLTLPAAYPAFVKILHQLAGMADYHGGNGSGRGHGDPMDTSVGMIGSISHLSMRARLEASLEGDED